MLCKRNAWLDWIKMPSKLLLCMSLWSNQQIIVNYLQTFQLLSLTSNMLISNSRPTCSISWRITV